MDEPMYHYRNQTETKTRTDQTRPLQDQAFAFVVASLIAPPAAAAAGLFLFKAKICTKAARVVGLSLSPCLSNTNLPLLSIACLVVTRETRPDQANPTNLL